MNSAEDPVLEALLEHVSHHGVASASLANLAEATGLSKSGLFARFGSRAALHQSVVDGVINRFLQIVWIPHADEEPGEDRLRNIISDWTLWVQGKFLSGGCPISRLISELGNADIDSRHKLVESQNKWLKAIAKEFAAIDERLRVTDKDDQAAFELHCLIVGYGIHYKNFSDQCVTQKLQVAVDRLIREHRQIL